MTRSFTKFNWATISDSTSKPYRIRAVKALEYIDWVALRTVATKARNIPCAIGDQYGLGGRHVVREIVFDDDEHWIARVGIPPVNFREDQNHIPAPLRQTWTTDKSREMQSEIDTMSFLRQNTGIPIPRVFVFDATSTNTVGAPYMLMECCMGTCAMDMPDSLGDIPSQYKAKYFASEASILVNFPAS